MSISSSDLIILILYFLQGRVNKWSQMVWNDSKVSQMVPLYPKLSQSVLNGPKWSILVKKGPRWSQMERNISNLSWMVSKGSTCSKWYKMIPMIIVENSAFWFSLTSALQQEIFALMKLIFYSYFYIAHWI